MSVRLTDQEVERVVATHGRLLFRVSFLILGNPQDAEDAVQETLYRYLERGSGFADADHEKAWLITVATNLSRNLRRFHFCHDTLDLDDVEVSSEDAEPDEVLEAVLGLPPAYLSILHLHYMEGYSTKEIARILRMTQSAVLKRLQRGRQRLKLELGGHA